MGARRRSCAAHWTSWPQAMPRIVRDRLLLCLSGSPFLVAWVPLGCLLHAFAKLFTCASTILRAGGTVLAERCAYSALPSQVSACWCI